MCKSSVELGLVYKTFVNKTLEKLHCCPEKQTISTVHVTVGCFGKLNKVIFPSQPKNTSLETFFPSESVLQPADWSALMGALFALTLVDAGASGAFFWEKCPYRSSTVVYVIKNNDRKNSPKLVRIRKWDFWHRNTLLYIQTFFFKLCPCLAWESNSLTV